MSVEQRLIALLFSVGFFLITIQLIRRRKLREEHALLWLLTSLVIVFFSIVPGMIEIVGATLQVGYSPAVIFALGLLLALAMLLSQSVVITNLSDHVRDLGQNAAILDWQVRNLEKKISNNISQMTVPGNGHDASGAQVDASSLILTSVEQIQTVDKPDRPSKVLVIGLDGATFDLIEPWAIDGYLPALNHIMQEGAWGRLRSTVPPMTAPAWTAFATGTNPGKHGVYDWIARRPDSYRFSPVTSRGCMVPTIYSLLGQNGRRVCSLNVPMTYPPEPVNGVMVSGLPAPSTQATITYPSTLYQEMVRAIGDYILYPDPGQGYSDAGVDGFLERLYRSGELRIRAFDYMRSLEKWDFAMAVFNGTDTVGHAMWKYMDQKHLLHDPSRYAKYGGAIKEYYQFVDKYLAKIIQDLDDDTTLVIMSDHGFGPFYKFIHVNNWLIQKGFMSTRSGLRSRTKRALFELGFAPMNIYDVMMRFGLGALKREVVRGHGQSLLQTLFLSFDDVDWRHTRAYSIGNVGQIYLNVVGREPVGCVQPGEEYEQVRDQIISQLSELRDPETGETVVEAIYRREEIYGGDQLEKAADIIFIPRRMEYFGFGEYEFGSHKIIEPMKRGISGTHRLDGVFLAYGRSIRSGLRVEGAQIIDLAPTILYLMGEPVPDHMDGRVLQEIVDEGFQPARSERKFVQSPFQRNESDEQLSEEDESVIAERLRNLGYVG